MVDNRLVSLIDLPATMLDFADVYVPSTFLGVSVFDGSEANERRNSIFIQLCKSQTRAVRTDKYNYSVTAPRLGALSGKAKIYFEAYLYDLSHDSNEKMNLANDKNFKEIRKNLSDVLLPEMEKAWEEKPKIKQEDIKKGLSYVEADYKELIETIEKNNDISLENAFKYLVFTDKFLRICKNNIVLNNDKITDELSEEVEKFRKAANQIVAKHSNH